MKGNWVIEFMGASKKPWEIHLEIIHGRRKREAIISWCFNIRYKWVGAEWVLNESCFIKQEQTSGTEGITLLPDFRILHCDSAIKACQRLYTACLSTTDASSTIGPDESLGSRGRTTWTSAWACGTALSSSKPPSKLATSGKHNKNLGAKSSIAFYVASKIPKDLPSTLSLC